MPSSAFRSTPKLVWATGFSQGGSMTWWLACAAGQHFTAFAPFAGAFWEPIRTECPGGPANLLHAHGLDDTTVPMAGRRIGAQFRHRDVLSGLGVWRQVNGCLADRPDLEHHDGGFSCRGWSNCTSGRELRLCLHEGGHELRPAWISRAWAFIRAVAGRR